MEELKIKIAELEALVKTALGLHENLLSFVISKHGKEEYMKHLKFIVDADGTSKEAKAVALEVLRQNALWSDELLSGPKQ